MANKEVREIERKLIAQGWRIIVGGHYKIAIPPDPTKPRVPIPGTPGRGRWKQNLIAQLRRSGADL